MFDILDYLKELLVGVQHFFNLVVGFFDLIAQAFESLYFFYQFVNNFFAYVPGEVSSVVVMSLLGYVGSFVMW